jgi:PadR family transcriptional regulator PadR
VSTVDDSNAASKKFQKELKSGTVALVLLGILDRAEEPMYGYLIAKRTEAAGLDMPLIKQGALYPVLRSLQQSGLLESRVEPSVSGPPRRYYRITETGRSTLDQWIEIWNQTRSFVDGILKGSHDD